LLTKRLPLQLETIQQRATAVSRLVENDQPLDYYNTIILNYDTVTLAQAQHAAWQYITPDHLVIAIVGDRRVIEPGLQAAHVAPVVVVDSL
jgi:predicted Zn-dependent peptidase